MSPVINRGTVSETYQAIELRDRLGVGLTDVPHLDAPLAAGVDELGRIGDGHGAHHLTMGQGVDLAGMARDSGRVEGIGRKGDRIDLALAVHMKRVGRFTARNAAGWKAWSCSQRRVRIRKGLMVEEEGIGQRPEREKWPRYTSPRG